MNSSAANRQEAELSLRRVTILGATGSVGLSTASVIEKARRHHGAHAYPVAAVTAHRDVEGLAHMAQRLGAAHAAIADADCLPALRALLADSPITCAGGADAVIEAAAMDAEWVMAAIIGSAGLAPLLASIGRGATVALANKEALVCAGHLVRQQCVRSGARLLPVDSEHNAVFQAFEPSARAQVERVTLTASGGPFRTWSRERMEKARVEEAVAHPNWSMGRKISVDSATLMNKGLELIEAHYLFDLPAERLDAIVHPQSIVHALVHYADGSVLAQLAAPDMETPIAHSLAWPERAGFGGARLDMANIAQLDFEPPDHARFPMLQMARAAIEAGTSGPLIINAANEVAVAAFLGGKAGFLDIARIVERLMEAADGAGLLNEACHSLDAVERLDGDVREMTLQVMADLPLAPADRNPLS